MLIDERHETYKEIGCFLRVSFSLPLFCVLLTCKLEVASRGALYFIIFGIEAAAPMIAALLCTFLMKGKRRIRIFLTEKYITHFNIGKCIAAFMGPVIILLIANLICLLVREKTQFITFLTSKKCLIIAWTLIAEELGWRGYLQERLEVCISTCYVPLIIGSIWFLWHYHFFLGGTMEVLILPFLFGCITESYGYYVLTKWARGNIIPASVWHFSGNLFFNLFALGGHGNKVYSIAQFTYGLCMLLFIWYVKKYPVKIDNRA